LPARITAGELRVHLFHADFDGLGRGPLQHRVERRVDAVTLGVDLPFGQAVEHLILNHINKISRGTGVQRRANEEQGNLLSSLRPHSRRVEKKKVRATCIVMVLAPCAFAPRRTSAHAAPRIRMGSKPGWSKKRRSSADRMASTRSLGRSAKPTKRRFSRAAW